jgi:putative transposase
MVKKKFSAEEIVAKLRQVDELTSLGRSVGDALLSIGVTEVAYQRWRSEFGGLARTLRPSCRSSLTKAKPGA